MASQTLLELRTSVKAWSNRSDISDTLIDDFINVGMARAIRKLRLPIMESSSTITLETDGSALIPRDYLEAIDLRVTVSGVTYTLERKDISQVQEWRSLTGAPKYFARRGTSFILAPEDSSVTQVQLYYYITFQPLVEDTDTNWFITDAPEMLLYGALAELALYVRDEIAASTWEAKFQNSLESIQDLADGAQWSGSTLSISRT